MLIQWGGKMTELRGVGAISVALPSSKPTVPMPLCRCARAPGIENIQPMIAFALSPDERRCITITVNGKFETAFKN
jgi:hypothetical protein